MKIKKLVSHDTLKQWVKMAAHVAKIKSPHIRNKSIYRVFKRQTRGHALTSFLYFFFKETIENFDEKKFEEIKNRELEEALTQYILKKKKRAWVDKRGRLIYAREKIFLTLLKRINDKLPEGEKFFCFYEYENSFQKGNLLFIKKGNSILWHKEAKVQQKNQKGVQLKLQFD